MTLDTLFDKRDAGKRIRLVYTDDQFTKLKPGDLGTIRYYFRNLDSICVVVEWDSGSNLSLIFGKDQWEEVK